MIAIKKRNKNIKNKNEDQISEKSQKSHQNLGVRVVTQKLNITVLYILLDILLYLNASSVKKKQKKQTNIHCRCNT